MTARVHNLVRYRASPTKLGTGGSVWQVERRTEAAVHLAGPVAGWARFRGVWRLEVHMSSRQIPLAEFEAEWVAFTMPPPPERVQ